MARLTIRTLDGAESSWEISPDTPVRIGRDPDNEIALHDPRASRHHARITFEKGFFVIYDLSSANGTYVQGKRIQIAPLVNGSELKIGGSRGRFEDEPRPDAVATVMVDLSELSPPPRAPSPVTDETTDPDRKSTKEEESPEIDVSSKEHRFRIDLGDWESTGVIENGEGKPLFYFLPPHRLAGWLGGLLAAMVAATGLCVAVVLALQQRPFSALAGALIAAAFSLGILAVTPRRELVFASDEQLQEVRILLRQQDRVPLTMTRYAALDPQGNPLAYYSKRWATHLGRRRWWILDEQSRPLGWAEEDSLSRAMARKVAGKSLKAFRSNYRLIFEGKLIGTIERREENLLDLSKGAPPEKDRQILIPLSVLIVALES
ncbi:MAG TPA: FHA domain-containing protein [Thermoanaerobaculia bacterium]|nr:FHA domain-containing protein [Thermoanaerobaculia bacterium]